MCGIAGYFSPSQPLEVDRLLAMREALRHRGPDGAGLVCWETLKAPTPQTEGQQACAALSHRRLSIIDLSEAGAQPMPNEDASVWISYNGEFYNFPDYRAELEAAGHRFRSHCDTETILHLYESYGIEETLRRMNGMFAFGLWDQPRQRLFLARDRMGQKPLFYVSCPDGTLAFASEIKALIAAGLVDTRRRDATAMDQFWTFGYTMGEQTIFSEVKQLLPGHYAVWEHGALQTFAYWENPTGKVQPFESTDEDIIESLHTLLQDAVRCRLMADVPLGLFLSGGIDSALICALASKINPNLTAYTISFPGDPGDESQAAARLAQHLGIPHRILPVAHEEAAAYAPIAQAFDVPFGDVSSIPTHAVCKAAREHAVVTLTGDAGDELFAGYDDYREGLRLWGTPQQRHALARPRNLRGRISDFLHRRHLPAPGFCRWGRKFSQRHKKRFYAPAFLAALDFDETLKARTVFAEEVGDADPLTAMQMIDQHTYLPDDILVKLDRMSMAVSLECRSPFLDYRVVEFAARLPAHLRMNDQGQGKVILRRLLSRYFPMDWFDQPKTGFTPPWQLWYAAGLRQQLREDWAYMPRDQFRPDGADFLFPEAPDAFSALSWNAASCEVFMKSLGETGR